MMRFRVKITKLHHKDNSMFIQSKIVYDNKQYPACVECFLNSQINYKKDTMKIQILNRMYFF